MGAVSQEPIFDPNCTVCGEEIKTMAFVGTGVCGELHFKVSMGKMTKDEADRQFKPLSPVQTS